MDKEIYISLFVPVIVHTVIINQNTINFTYARDYKLSVKLRLNQLPKKLETSLNQIQRNIV